jgi:RimJ/RimL family protein N-acetyltransferase
VTNRRQPVIDLGTARLRPWVSEDAVDLVLLRSDPLVRHYSGRLIEHRGEALAAMTRWSAGWLDSTGAGWALVERGGALLGAVSYGLVDHDLLTGSVGYELAPEARGRGLATAAVRATTLAVFERLKWHRIELYHAVENERSCGVARRSGYRLEGVMRSAMRYPADGRRSDEHLHARLATDEPPA